MAASSVVRSSGLSVGSGRTKDPEYSAGKTRSNRGAELSQKPVMRANCTLSGLFGPAQSGSFTGAQSWTRMEICRVKCRSNAALAQQMSDRPVTVGPSDGCA